MPLPFLRDIPRVAAPLPQPESTELEQLWHYDADYPYDPEKYEYSEWHTTDPYYLQEDVSMVQSLPHSALLQISTANLIVPAGRLGLVPYNTACVSQLQKFLQYLPSQLPIPPETVEAILADPHIPQHFGYLPSGRLRHLLLHYTGQVPADAWEKVQARSYVEPDVGLWDRHRIDPATKMIPWSPATTPWLVLEVLSESTADKDFHVNPLLYGLMGVQEYWICHPDTERITHVWKQSPASPWDNILAHRTAGTEPGVALGDTDGVEYSQVLNTWINLDVSAGFQCWDRQGNVWITGDPDILQEQLAEKDTQLAEKDTQLAEQSQTYKQLQVQSLLDIAAEWTVAVPDEVVQALLELPLAIIPTTSDLRDVKDRCTENNLHHNVLAYLRERAGLPPLSCPPQ